MHSASSFSTSTRPLPSGAQNMQLATRLSALQRTAVVAGHDLVQLLASLLSEGIEALAAELQQLVESSTLLSSSPPTRR